MTMTTASSEPHAELDNDRPNNRVRTFCRKRSAMSSDDETILSAYLDGELDSDQQQRVESALVASPGLAENLRALADRPRSRGGPAT